MERNSGYILITVIVILIFSIFITMDSNGGINEKKTEKKEKEQKITLIQNNYPEFIIYPTNITPKKKILTQKEDIGWYITFLQEGLTRPILYAKCFFIGEDNIIQTIGEYDPEELTINKNFSIINCY